MGNSKSEEEKFLEDFDKFYQNPRYIAFDDNGNLFYGLVHPVSRSRQLRTIMKLDKLDEEPDKDWYVMDSAWIAAWLAYVHGDTKVAPAPGPCRNHRLIQWNYALGKYEGRDGLFMAVNERAGDFRRVSREVWEQFLQYYPGSGPTITMKYNASNPDSTESFVIVDPPEPPEDAQKKKKKKFTMKRLSSLGDKLRRGSLLSKGKKDEEGEEGEGEEESKRERPEDPAAEQSHAQQKMVIDQGLDSDDDDSTQPSVPSTRVNNAAPAHQTSAQSAFNISLSAKQERDSDDDDDADDAAVPLPSRRSTHSVDLLSQRNTSIDYAVMNAPKERRDSKASQSTQSAKRGEMLQQVYFKD